MEGTFSPSLTGESFPIIFSSNVNLIGQGEEVTILDAEQTNRVIIMNYCENNIILDITITGPINQASGFIYDIQDLKEIVNTNVEEVNINLLTLCFTHSFIIRAVAIKLFS